MTGVEGHTVTQDEVVGSAIKPEGHLGMQVHISIPPW